MKINVRLGKLWLIHGVPADEHITGLVECEVLAVEQFTEPASAKWRQPEKLSHSALVRVPDHVCLRTSPKAMAPAFWVSVSSTLNPSWRPPPFPAGVRRINVFEQGHPE